MPNFDDLDSPSLAIALDALARSLKSIREQQAAGQNCDDRDALEEAIADLKRRWQQVEAGQCGGDHDKELMLIRDAITVLERMRL